MAGFLDLFNVLDSDGVSATKYRLHYIGSTLSRQDSWIFGMLTELVYVLFQLMVIPANALLGAVLNSSAWMGTLGEFYQKLTAPLFAVFPPWGIACFGLAIVAVSALRSKPTPPARGAPPGNARGASMGMSSNALDRIGGALAMAAMVLVLTYNPFALIAKVLELANGFSLGLANAVTSSGNDTTLATGKALVDASIRTPTIALNYGVEMTAACRTQWSQAMVEGKALAENSGCFTAGANEASPGTLTTAVLMLILPALPMLVFCVIAAWKYLLHLSLAVFHLLFTAWVAAISVHKQRGFERLTDSFARAAAHLAMAVITSMLAVALPVTVAGVGTQLLGLVSGPQAQAFVMMVSLGIGFGVSAWAINKVVSSHGSLVKVLHADAGANLNALMGNDVTKFKFVHWNTWVTNKTVPPDTPSQARADARKAARQSALSSDPVTSTASSRPERATVSDPDNDVAQLMSGAQSVADAGAQNSTAESSVGVSGVVGDLAEGAAITAITMATTTGTSDTSSPTVMMDPATTAGDRYAYWIGGPVPTTGTGDTAVSAEDPGVPALQTGTNSPAGGSALADPPRLILPDAGGAPPAVPGLMGADPALEAASRDTGATYVATPKPAPSRQLSQLISRFNRYRALGAPAGGVPEVEYGPPLSPAPDLTAAATEALLPDTDQRPTEANDQQRWNQKRGVRGSFRRGDDAPAANDAGVELVTGPDVRPDPGSFQAPQADFLAADDLQSQIDEVMAVSGAAGAPITIEISPDDRRLGIDFSSDPDERIRPSNPPGFGDPV